MHIIETDASIATTFCTVIKCYSGWSKTHV